MNVIKKYFIFFILTLILNGCKVNYSMSGASIAPDVKTITIKYFTKTASLGPTTLSQVFTERLKEKFLTQSSLTIQNGNSDLTLEGTISSYVISPQAIQANEIAATNRLSITVNVKFTNLKDEKQNYETTFSHYSDYPSSQNITSIEDKLINDITDQLVDDIFNKSVINW